jgi:hypothetical protein
MTVEEAEKEIKALFSCEIESALNAVLKELTR